MGLQLLENTFFFASEYINYIVVISHFCLHILPLSMFQVLLILRIHFGGHVRVKFSVLKEI